MQRPMSHIQCWCRICSAHRNVKVLVRVGSNVPNFHEIRYISWELVHKLVHVLLFIFCKGVWPATPLPCSDKTNVWIFLLNGSNWSFALVQQWYRTFFTKNWNISRINDFVIWTYLNLSLELSRQLWLLCTCF